MRFLSSIKFKVAIVIAVFVLLVAAFFLILSRTVENQIVEGFKAQIAREKLSLFNNFIEKHREEFSYYVRKWIQDQKEFTVHPPDYDKWRSILSGVTSQWAIRHGVNYYQVFNRRQELVLDLKTGIKKNDFKDPWLKQNILSEAVDTELLTEGVAYDSANDPYLITIVTSPDESGYASHYHVFAVDIRLILKHFTEAVGHDIVIEGRGENAIANRLKYEYKDQITVKGSPFYKTPDGKVFLKQTVFLPPNLLNYPAKLIIYKDMTGLVENLDQNERNVFYALLISSIVAIPLFAILLFLILRPLFSLSTFARRVGEGDLRFRHNDLSRSEIQEITSAFNSVLDLVEKKEKENEDLVLAIERDQKATETLLYHMKQAVLMVGPGGQISSPVSQSAISLLGPELTEKTLDETLFTTIKKNSQEYTFIKSALANVFEEDKLQWSVLESHLPKRIILEKSQEKLLLRVTYTPIFDANSKLKLILIIAEVIGKKSFPSDNKAKEPKVV